MRHDHNDDHDLGLVHDLSRLQQQAVERRTALRWLMGAGALPLGGAGATVLAGCGGGGSSEWESQSSSQDSDPWTAPASSRGPESFDETPF